LDRALGCADARTFFLLLHVGLADRQALDREREPARGDEGLGAFIEKPRVDERFGDELAQILGRARLHARRYFLGEELEQKIGHCEQVAGAVAIVKPKSGRCSRARRLCSPPWARRHAAHLQ
jgi:hypothetical protein